MKRLSNAEFKAQVETKKGEVGERIAKAEFTKQGYTVISTQTRGPHNFDFTLYLGDKAIALGDVKTKARMNKYCCTGIDKHCYDSYKKSRIRTGLPFLLVFVDEGLGEIYGHLLNVLEQPYSEDRWPTGTNKAGIMYYEQYNYPQLKKHKDLIIYFPYIKMLLWRKLTQEEITEIRNLEKRNYEYDM